MNEKLIIIDQNNKNIKCNVIGRWKDNKTNYLAYTTDEMENNKLKLFVCKYKLENNKIMIEDIPSIDEWQYVNNYLKENLFGKVDYYE